MILSLGLNHAIFSRNTKWNQAFTRNMQGANFLNLIPQTWIDLTRPKTDEQRSKWNWFHTKESLKKFQVQNRTRPFHPPTVSSFRTNFQNVISDDLEIRSSFHFSAQTLASFIVLKVYNTLDNIIIISIWKAYTLSSYHIIAMATHWVPSSDPKWEHERVRCDQNCRWITINIIAINRPAKSFTKTLVRRTRIIIHFPFMHKFQISCIFNNLSPERLSNFIFSK